MKASTLVYVAAGAAGIGLAIALLRGAKGAKEAAGKVIEAVNPASPNNVAYKAANVITETLTGAPAGSTSVGSWLYDFINPNVPKADAPTRPTPRVPSIDLGTYADTIARDDAELTQFSRDLMRAQWSATIDADDLSAGDDMRLAQADYGAAAFGLYPRP